MVLKQLWAHWVRGFRTALCYSYYFVKQHISWQINSDINCSLQNYQHKQNNTAKILPRNRNSTCEISCLIWLLICAALYFKRISQWTGLYVWREARKTDIWVFTSVPEWVGLSVQAAPGLCFSAVQLDQAVDPGRGIFLKAPTSPLPRDKKQLDKPWVQSKKHTQLPVLLIQSCVKYLPSCRL